MRKAALPFEPFRIDSRKALRLQADFRQRGVAVLSERALETDCWSALLEEAKLKRSNGAWQLQSQYNTGEISQDNTRGFLGPHARNFLRSSQTCNLLRAVTGHSLEPGWSASCYTYYDVPGAYMGEHCDKFDACRIALLVFLEARWPQEKIPGPGMSLRIFEGDSSSSPLVATVTAHSNRVVILNGAAQAHYRPPVGPDESLLMLAGCYQMAVS